MAGGGIGDMWVNYGPERDVPVDAQMYVLTNEQYNFIASLVTGVNDVFSFQIPYPFYINHRTHAIIFHRIDFLFRSKDEPQITTSIQARLQIDLQYSDKEAAANWDGVGEDVEDENIQAMFDGPFMVGHNKGGMAPDTDAGLSVYTLNSSIVNVHYYPPDRNGLDAFFPLTVHFTNATFDRDLVEQIPDAASFNAFEKFSIRCYFTVRKLTRQEKNLMQSEYYGLVPLS